MNYLEKIFQKNPKNKSTYWTIFVIWFFTFSYAVLRYVFFGPYDINAIPLFVVNKSFAFSFMILSYFLSNPKVEFINRKIVGIFTYFFALLHAIISAILIPTSFFEKFYNEENLLTFTAATMIFFGVLAIILSVVISKSFLKSDSSNPFWKTFYFERLYLFFLLFLGLHIFIFYFPNWIKVQNWHGYMPPISLLSFLFLLGITMNFFKRVFLSKK